jgi:hypothetical protein
MDDRLDNDHYFFDLNAATSPFLPRPPRASPPARALWRPSTRTLRASPRAGSSAGARRRPRSSAGSRRPRRVRAFFFFFFFALHSALVWFPARLLGLLLLLIRTLSVHFPFSLFSFFSFFYFENIKPADVHFVCICGRWRTGLPPGPDGIASNMC